MTILIQLMKPLLKLFIICSYLLIFPKFLIACGPYISNNETHFCLFGVSMNGYKGLQPFYYSEYFLNSYIPDPQGLDYQTNCKEWYDYIKDPKVSMQDIYSFQYKTNADTFLDNYYKGNWQPIRKNTFVQYLLQAKNKKILAYFLLAKKIEQTQDGLQSIWEKDIAPNNMDSMQAYAKQALLLSKKTKDVFLKQRYAFQAIKMSYYSRNTDIVALDYCKQFEKTLMGKNTIVTAWGYLFYGLLQTDSMKKIEALLNAFDLSEEKKVFCYKKLFDTDKDALYNYYKDPRLREIIIALKGMSNYGKAINEIKQLHAINPNSKYLPLLVGREINKVETWVWSYEYLGFDNTYLNDTQFSYRWAGDYNVRFSKDITYLNELTLTVKSIYEKLSAKDAFYALATAHLFNMQNNFNDAQKILDKLTIQTDNYYYNQYLIEQVIVKSQLDDITNTKTKAYFANALTSINKIKEQFKNDKFWYVLNDNEQVDDADELMLYLSKEYQKIGDIVTAGLLYQKTSITTNEYGKNVYYTDSAANNYGSIVFFDKYASIEQVYQLMTFKNKSDKSPFEKFISPIGWASDDLYLDLIGTKYMREEQYKKALTVFEKINSNFWENNYYFKDYIPATSIFYLGHYAPWDSILYNNYNKISKTVIAQELVALEEAIASTKGNDELLAGYYYLLGNAKLNMTYNGNFWMMISYGKFYGENRSDKGNFYTYSFYPNYLKYGDQYYLGATAVAAFDKAFQLSKNSTLKTKIYCSKRLNDYLNGKANNKNIAMYNEVKNNKLFQLVAIQCPYL